jgi:hypothetical protein
MHRAVGPDGDPELHAEPAFMRLVGYDLRVEISRLLLVRMKKAVQLPPLAARMPAGAVRADCTFLARTFDLMAQRRLLPDMWAGSETALIYKFAAVERPFVPIVFPDAHSRDELMRAFGRLQACARLQQPHVRRLVNSCGESAEAELRAADAVAHSTAMRACALSSCSARETHVAQFKLCAACKGVIYCSKAHQVQDWPAHKAVCKAARKAAATTTTGNNSAASGAS